MSRPVLPALLAMLLSLALAGFACAQDSWYKIDALNSGLGERPDSMDLVTPQSAVESFLDAMERDDVSAAAHALDLTDIDPDKQPVRGPILARQLDSVLTRKAVISWRQLLDRPDALDAEQSGQAAMAGKPRRSILIDVLDTGDREAAIRLNRVKPEDGDPVWVFSRTTVRKVPLLHDLYGPSALEEELPDFLRVETVIGLKRWEVLGLPLVAALAYLVGRLMYSLFSWLSKRAERNWTTLTLKALRWPSIIFVVTSLVLFSTLRVFTVSGTVAAFLTPLTVIGYVTAVLLFALRVIDAILNRLVTFDSDKLADPENSAVRNLATSMTAARRALIILGLIVAMGFVLASINVYRTLGFSLLASAGALTIVIGFAARQVLGNILASLQIALNRSARIGDQVIYEGKFCTVERIHFTFVQLKTWNGNRLVVPVGHFLSDYFENLSLVDGSMVRYAEVTLSHEADIDALRERFLELADEEDEISPKDRSRVNVLSQNALGPVVRFEFACSDPGTWWATECRMRENILKAAREIEVESGRKMLSPWRGRRRGRLECPGSDTRPPAQQSLYKPSVNSAEETT